MYGICGVMRLVPPGPAAPRIPEDAVVRMRDAMVHRGPDDARRQRQLLELPEALLDALATRPRHPVPSTRPAGTRGPGPSPIWPVTLLTLRRAIPYRGGDELSGRTRSVEDDQPAVARGRQQEYIEKTAPLKAYYEKQGLLRTIDGVGSPEGIYAEIKKQVGK